MKFGKWFMSEYNLKLNDKNKTIIKIGRKYLPALKDKFRF